MAGKTMEALGSIDAPSSSAKLVLIAFAYFRDEVTGDCWPSREEVGAWTGLGKTALGDAITALLEAGLISTFNRRDRNGLPAPKAIDLEPALRIADGTPYRKAEPESGRHPESGAQAGFRSDTQKQGISGSGRPPSGPLSRGGGVQSSSRLKEKDRTEEDAGRARPTRAEGRKLAQAALAIWEVTPSSPRARCRNDVVKVEFALKDAVGRGEDLEETVAGCRAYYATRQDDEGRQAAAPNVLVDRGYWRADAPAPQAPPTPRQAAAASSLDAEWAKWAPELWGGPEGTHPVGTDEEPGAMRQYRWLEVYFGRPADERDIFWDDRQGPRPGKPGSRVWPGLLDRYLELNPKARG